jgi:glucose/arabinose dehydrogenase/cytochrome c5
MKKYVLPAALLATALTGAVVAQTPSAPAPAPAGAPPASGAAAPAGRGAGRGPASPQAQIFAANCASCHGADMNGARAPSLVRADFLASTNDETIRKVIADGEPDQGMPAFKGTLSDTDIGQLIAYIRNQSGRFATRPAYVPEIDGQVIKSQKLTFRITVLASGLDTPWGETFLPDGRMLVTERAGRIRILDHGKLLPEAVKNTPVPWVRQDGGYFDIAVGPNYAKDRWVYLAYSELAPGAVAPPLPPPGQRQTTPLPPSMTRIVRGHINAKNEWVGQQDVYRVATSLYTPSIIHYGMRMLFDNKGHLFFTQGERGDHDNAQKLNTPLGKIHRINTDLSVPKDNPFVNIPDAVPTIWSYGNRNPEGLAYDPVTGLLWESEHGPTGGDEINVIDKGHNYGWGVITMGQEPGLTLQNAPGMEPPITYYSPSIGPSALRFYTGDKYPGWKNNMFMGGLTGQKIVRYEIQGRKIVSQEVLFAQFGRVRDILQGPDGLFYVLLQSPPAGPVFQASPGMVVRLDPVN